MRIKCGLHNHSCLSDGYFTVGGLLSALKEAGYHAISITDHNTVTVPHPLQLREVRDLLLIRGVEVTFPSVHIIALEPIVTDKGFLELFRTASVTWIAHPSWSMLRPEDCRQICRENHLDGVELYNSGHVAYNGEIDGNFYAGDDLHEPSQLMTSWIEMDVDSLDKETILEKLKAGDYELFNRPSP